MVVTDGDGDVEDDEVSKKEFDDLFEDSIIQSILDGYILNGTSLYSVSGLEDLKQKSVNRPQRIRILPLQASVFEHVQQDFKDLLAIHHQKVHLLASPPMDNSDERGTQQKRASVHFEGQKPIA